MRTLGSEIVRRHVGRILNGPETAQPHVYTRHEWLKWLTVNDFIVAYGPNEEEILKDILSYEHKAVKFVLIDDSNGWYLCVGKP